MPLTARSQTAERPHKQAHSPCASFGHTSNDTAWPPMRCQLSRQACCQAATSRKDMRSQRAAHTQAQPCVPATAATPHGFQHHSNQHSTMHPSLEWPAAGVRANPMDANRMDAVRATRSDGREKPRPDKPSSKSRHTRHTTQLRQTVAECQTSTSDYAACRQRPAGGARTNTQRRITQRPCTAAEATATLSTQHHAACITVHHAAVAHPLDCDERRQHG